MDLRKYVNQIKGNSLWNLYVRCAAIRSNLCLYEYMGFAEIYETNEAYTDWFQFILAWMISEGDNGYSFLERLVNVLKVPVVPEEDDEYLEILEWHKKQPKIIPYTAVSSEEYWQAQTPQIKKRQAK